jgi:hypothetical protein
MKLYLLEQDVVTGYDTFDSCVVVADSEQSAKLIHPRWCSIMGEDNYTWPDNPADVKATYLGLAEDPTPRIVCASFNAG